MFDCSMITNSYDHYKMICQKRFYLQWRKRNQQKLELWITWMKKCFTNQVGYDKYLLFFPIWNTSIYYCMSKHLPPFCYQFLCHYWQTELHWERKISLLLLILNGFSWSVWLYVCVTANVTQYTATLWK